MPVWLSVSLAVTAIVAMTGVVIYLINKLNS